MKMPNFIRNALKKWCIKNFPLEITTIYKVQVKKGKIREWRYFYSDGTRIFKNLQYEKYETNNNRSYRPW